jgi:hypothetical protein
LFDGDVLRVGHEETRRLLLRDNALARPVPEITFSDRYTLEVGGERASTCTSGGPWTAQRRSPTTVT